MKSLIFLLLLLPNFHCDDDNMRNYLMPVTAGAYSDNPNDCWSNAQKYMYQNASETYSIYRQYTVKCASFNDTCSGYIALTNLLNVPYVWVYVVFRGTNNNYGFIENGWNYDEMVPFVAGGKVSKVFFDGFNALWNAGMKDDLLTLKNKYSPKINFQFLGHSIGGAMASLAAGTFAKLGNTAFLYTYGQPRVGNENFADAMNALIPSVIFSTRIIHNADIAPHLPPLNESTNYYHFKDEIWYNNDMSVNGKYLDCGGYPYFDEEDPRCSDSLNATDYNMEDHKNYYGRDFIEYGKNGCPGLVKNKKDNDEIV